MNTSILAQELEPLNAQIEQARKKLGVLEDELRVVEAELEAFAADQQRFDALLDVCNALDKLGELGAGELFWDEVAEAGDASGHLDRLRGRVARFEGEIRGVKERRETLRKQADQRLDELDVLYDEVRNAYAREERRQEEFVVERELSPVPYRQMIMPWTADGESEKQFRRAVLVALLLSMVFGSLFSWVNIPIPDRSSVVVEIPERLAMLVKKEPIKPPPAPKPDRPLDEAKPESAQEKPEKTEKSDKTPKTPAKQQQIEAPQGGGNQTARKKAESVGVLAFKNSFKDLMDETPVASLGTEAHLNKNAAQAAGQARAQRSMVALQGRGSSGGIANAGVSVNLGTGGGGGGGGGGGIASGIGGVGVARVASSVAGVAAEARPLSDGPGPGRTDEEIQIVFDRYKATLYRIYNKELRKDPTLRGKMLLRITIEPGGEVSACNVESTDLASPELVAQIVERVQKFNFGPKDGVPKTTILYPIDFLPAG